MHSRREFLSRATTILLLVPIAARCSSSSSSAPAASNGACDGVDTTSSTDQFHSHTLCVPTTDLTNAPAAGMTYITSNVSSHTHKVVLTQAQLQTIAAGGSVTVLCSNDVDPLNGAAHTHTFAISKTAGM